MNKYACMAVTGVVVVASAIALHIQNEDIRRYRAAETLRLDHVAYDRYLIERYDLIARFCNEECAALRKYLVPHKHRLLPKGTSSYWVIPPFDGFGWAEPGALATMDWQISPYPTSLAHDLLFWWSPKPSFEEWRAEKGNDDAK